MNGYEGQSVLPIEKRHVGNTIFEGDKKKLQHGGKPN
jgi:hypothetical protein